MSWAAAAFAGSNSQRPARAVARSKATSAGAFAAAHSRRTFSVVKAKWVE